MYLDEIYEENVLNIVVKFIFWKNLKIYGCVGFSQFSAYRSYLHVSLEKETQRKLMI